MFAPSLQMRAGPVDLLPRRGFDHEPIVHAAGERLRAKLSYTNVGYALALDRFTELRELYAATLDREVTSTNVRRVLPRCGVFAATGATPA